MFDAMGSALPDETIDIDPTLRRFCLSPENAFLVPAEALGEHGVAPNFGGWLVQEGRLTLKQLECLSRGFGLYWQRCAALHANAPGSWFPPRQTNLVIAPEARGVLPYLEPFRGTSSLIYKSDLDTDPEYVAVLIIHMERLALLRSPPATMVFNLSYWFERDAASRAAFDDAARRSTRPDAAAFVALANAFSWIDELLHDPLRPPRQELSEPYLHIDGADLYVPKRLQPQLVALGEAVEAAVRRAFEVTAPRLGTVRSRALDELCDWLTDARAHVIVHGPHGGTLWTPEHDDPIRVKRVLAEANEQAVASIHADLRVVDERSRQFLGCVNDVDSLPTHCAVLETGGGAYIDAARRAVVYELQQPAFDATTGGAPPFHRLLLGARVMHEWGHVAHTAKILRLSEAKRPDYVEARAELGAAFMRVVDSVPEQVRAAVDEELRSIEPNRADLSKALTRRTLGRVGDYLANMMMSRLIPGEEMQAYVRTNVGHHLDEHLGLVSELARYAYEIHYLDLAGLPRSYFYGTSRFPDHFIATGIVREADAEALFDAAGRVLACYEIDESRITLPAHSVQ